MSTDAQRTIAVCIAAFNRREKTLACLRSLKASELPEGLGLSIYLLDDASTDGTGAAVREAFPDVQILEGTGSLYWAGGMRRAYGAALQHPHPYYIWMNDDVVARPEAIARLVAVERALHAADGKRHLVSGGMWDPAAGKASYGAYRLANRLNPSSIVFVPPDPERPQPCDLLNANMLLIPGEVAAALGNIPDSFDHTLADWHYSLEAKRHGFGAWLAPGFYGDCAGNVAMRRRWHDPQLTLKQRYQKMLHPLALPFRSRAYYLFRHFPLTAPAYLVVPYIKMPIQHLLGQFGRAPAA